jgi:DNA-binding GntR family transcriptional regulator
LRIDQTRYETSGRGVYCTRGYWRTDRFTFQLVRKAHHS